MSRIAAVAAALVALVPAGAAAQALSCALPASPDRPHPETATASEPQRLLPIGGYTLALTWSPERCYDHARDASSSFECGGGNRFGFTLHGLWPDGIGKEWPQYCKAAAILPPATVRAHLCATPSAQLLQHEWAKHGTCMAGFDPDTYFARSNMLYGKLRYPDMTALSRQRPTVGGFAQAFAAANPGVPASAVRVTVNRRGWLDELWLCLDKRFAYTACRAGSGGASADTALKIWRGTRSRSSRYGDSADRGAGG